MFKCSSYDTNIITTVELTNKIYIENKRWDNENNVFYVLKCFKTAAYNINECTYNKSYVIRNIM